MLSYNAEYTRNHYRGCNWLDMIFSILFMAFDEL